MRRVPFATVLKTPIHTANRDGSRLFYFLGLCRECGEYDT
jgi:hypothetical protein